MKLVWCPDTASKAYIDGVRAIAANSSCSSSPELAELVAAMAGGWNAQLIVDAPAASPSPSATSLALAAAARRTGGRYALLDDLDADDISPEDSASAAATTTEAAMARLEGVDLLVLDARRRDAAAVLRCARPGPRGMVVVVRHGDTVGGIRRRGTSTTAAAATEQPPWWGAMMAAGTRVVRAACLPIGGDGGVQVLHVGVGKGPSLPIPTTTSTQQQHGGHGGGSIRRSSAGGGGGGRGRWIRHVNHRTGEEHVFRRQ